MNIEYINKISPSDYNGLRKSVGWGTLSDRQAENVIKNSKYFTIAVINKKPIAMARVLSDNGNIYFIADVIVFPEYQGYGIGRMLMTNAIDFIKSDFEAGEVVQIHLASIKGKEDFYEKFGFRKRPNDEFGCGMTQWYTK